MIKAKIEHIDLNTGSGRCTVEDSNQEFTFNVLKLQDGDTTSLYRLKAAQEIYFNPESIDPSSTAIDAPYYLIDLNQQIALVKKVYSNPDRNPLIGDLVKTPNGMTRIARVDDSMAQLGQGKPYIYLDDGFASYSGTLDYPIPVTNLSDSGHSEKALFWTFKDGARANNGIDLELVVKVWTVKPEIQD